MINPPSKTGFKPQNLETLNSDKRLRDGQEEILRRWMDLTCQLVPAADHVARQQLRNAVPFFIEAVCTALAPKSALSDANDGNHIARDHGTQRLELGEYSLSELLVEYKLLRIVIFEYLERDQQLSVRDRDIILNSIEQAMIEAGMQFAELQRAKDAVAMANLEKSNIALEHFAAIAAHDLKSPISTISGFIEVLEIEFGAKIKKEATEHLAFIKAASTRMINLIDRLLEYSVLSPTTARFETVDMNAVTSSALANLKVRIEETKAEIKIQPLPEVNGDASLLTQLVQNLLANALKFSESAPRIEIDCKESAKDWIFSVKDNGIGFDPQHKEEIFALYKKLNSQSVFQGTGIGLATCKKVVEIHHGQIWALSEPTVGSTFYFSLRKR